MWQSLQGNKIDQMHFRNEQHMTRVYKTRQAVYYKVTWIVHATIVAEEKQWVLHNMGVYL